MRKLLNNYFLSETVSCVVFVKLQIYFCHVVIYLLRNQFRMIFSQVCMSLSLEVIKEILSLQLRTNHHRSAVFIWRNKSRVRVIEADVIVQYERFCLIKGRTETSSLTKHLCRKFTCVYYIETTFFCSQDSSVFRMGRILS